MSAAVTSAVAKLKELELELARLAELHVAACERRKDEEFLVAESLTRAMRACGFAATALLEACK